MSVKSVVTDCPKAMNQSASSARDEIPPGKGFSSNSTVGESQPCSLVIHAYQDRCHETEGGATDIRTKQKGAKRVRAKPRGGVPNAFPILLHEMLNQAESELFDHIVSWQPHGRSFAVHEPKRFVAEIMPRFFKQTVLTSFQRQLNLYGFCRQKDGHDRGGYYHELFLRGRSHLCQHMVRTRVKGIGMNVMSFPSPEPNFYDMEYCLDVGMLGIPEFHRCSSNYDSLPIRGLKCSNSPSNESGGGTFTAAHDFVQSTKPTPPPIQASVSACELNESFADTVSSSRLSEGSREDSTSAFLCQDDDEMVLEGPKANDWNDHSFQDDDSHGPQNQQNFPDFDDNYVSLGDWQVDYSEEELAAFAQSIPWP